jgi:transcriptional regulator with XRE-family HTH domain
MEKYTFDIGRKFKEARKAKNLTLQQLSERTGLSTGYLSNLERELSSPTLETLQVICEALDTHLVKMLVPSYQENPLVRKSERNVFYHSDTNDVVYEMLTSGNDTARIKGFCIRIAPNAEIVDRVYEHIYDEVGVVISGTLTAHMNGEVYTLEEGDCLYIRAHTKHTIHNKGTQELVTYWFTLDN